MIMALPLVFAGRLPAQSYTPQEIKAALMIKFTDFIRWPEASFSKHPDDFVLGILGEDRYSELLAPLAGRKIQGRPLTIKVFKDIKDVDQAQMLFIQGFSHKELDAILKSLSGRPILTLGDLSGFAEKGGILGFFDKNGRIGFKINTRAKKRSGLKFSSHLMRLAELVTGEQEVPREP